MNALMNSYLHLMQKKGSRGLQFMPCHFPEYQFTNIVFLFSRYNIQLINALVMYVGTSAIQFIRAKGLTPSMSTIAHSSHMDIFQNLAVDLETEGRYLFLNCIANQVQHSSDRGGGRSPRV